MITAFDFQTEGFETFCRITSLMVKEGELNFDDYVYLTTQHALVKSSVNEKRSKDYSVVLKKINDRIQTLDLEPVEGFGISNDRNLYKRIKSSCLNDPIRKEIAAHEQKHYEVLKSLNIVLETKDQYVAGHSERVAQYAMFIANKLNLSNTDKIILLYSAMFHDVGKLSVSEKILNKKGRLTESEYDEIKTHSRKGYEALKYTGAREIICETVLHHHERYDGKGYPDGLSELEIPELSRIIAVVDAFDAMTSDRSYRKALSFKQGKQALEENKGTQLDPFFVDIFIKIINEKYGEIL